MGCAESIRAVTAAIRSMVSSIGAGPTAQFRPMIVAPRCSRSGANRSGGVQGGISNGETIYFRVAFKPTATIMREQGTVTVDHLETTIKGRGRHDPCVLPRAVPMVEAMTTLVLADHALMQLAITGNA